MGVGPFNQYQKLYIGVDFATSRDHPLINPSVGMLSCDKNVDFCFAVYSWFFV